MEIYKLLLPLGLLAFACSGESLESDPLSVPASGGARSASGGAPGSPSGGAPTASGGATSTGGAAPSAGGSDGCGPIGDTGGTNGAATAFFPNPPQPTEPSCCFIWAHCIQNEGADYRCTDATRSVTDADDNAACDDWLEQVPEPLNAACEALCQ